MERISGRCFVFCYLFIVLTLLIAPRQAKSNLSKESSRTDRVGFAQSSLDATLQYTLCLTTLVVGQPVSFISLCMLPFPAKRTTFVSRSVTISQINTRKDLPGSCYSRAILRYTSYCKRLSIFVDCFFTDKLLYCSGCICNKHESVIMCYATGLRMVLPAAVSSCYTCVEYNNSISLCYDSDVDPQHCLSYSFLC